MLVLLQLSWSIVLLAGIAWTQSLAPSNDILLLDSSSATNPLRRVGSNSVWGPGPNVYGIPSEVPEGCTVQQAAYLVRHGSRFPDSVGTYQDFYKRIQDAIKANNLTLTGSLRFLKDWKNFISNPSLQLSQESLLGWKELHDFGFQLRARYPIWYTDGTPFPIWANQYASPITKSRVVQSAQAFLQGYLYVFAQEYGTIVSINSTGSVNALGNSLGPSDMCPAFANNDGTHVTAFQSTWIPAATERINSMISGNLTFSQSDITQFPVLCAYESMATGRLSPWCHIFDDLELTNYEYSQDLHYYYGPGPGSSGANTKLFLPFVDSLLTLLAKGPGQQGIAANGSTFTLPSLIMAFLNDNQLAEIISALGLFDAEPQLPSDHIPESYLFHASRFVSMRGTITFEVLNCTESFLIQPPPSTSPMSSSVPALVKPSDRYVASSIKLSGLSGLSTPTSRLYGGFHSTGSRVKVATATVTANTTITTDCEAEPTGHDKRIFPNDHYSPREELASGDQTYLRILLNDVVYVVPSCQDGPGKSCLLSKYASQIHEKLEAAGEFKEFCNVTAADAPVAVKGASFFTDLTLDFLTFVGSTFG